MSIVPKGKLSINEVQSFYQEDEKKRQLLIEIEAWKKRKKGGNDEFAVCTAIAEFLVECIDTALGPPPFQLISVDLLPTLNFAEELAGALCYELGTQQWDTDVIGALKSSSAVSTTLPILACAFVTGYPREMLLAARECIFSLVKVLLATFPVLKHPILDIVKLLTADFLHYDAGYQLVAMYQKEVSDDLVKLYLEGAPQTTPIPVPQKRKGKGKDSQALPASQFVPSSSVIVSMLCYSELPVKSEKVLLGKVDSTPKFLSIVGSDGECAATLLQRYPALAGKLGPSALFPSLCVGTLPYLVNMFGMMPSNDEVMDSYLPTTKWVKLWQCLQVMIAQSLASEKSDSTEKMGQLIIARLLLCHPVALLQACSEKKIHFCNDVIAPIVILSLQFSSEHPPLDHFLRHTTRIFTVFLEVLLRLSLRPPFGIKGIPSHQCLPEFFSDLLQRAIRAGSEKKPPVGKKDKGKKIATSQEHDFLVCQMGVLCASQILQLTYVGNVVPSDKWLKIYSCVSEHWNLTVRRKIHSGRFLYLLYMLKVISVEDLLYRNNERIRFICQLMMVRDVNIYRVLREESTNLHHIQSTSGVLQGMKSFAGIMAQQINDSSHRINTDAVIALCGMCQENTEIIDIVKDHAKWLESSFEEGEADAMLVSAKQLLKEYVTSKQSTDFTAELDLRQKRHEESVLKFKEAMDIERASRELRAIDRMKRDQRARTEMLQKQQLAEEAKLRVEGVLKSTQQEADDRKAQKAENLRELAKASRKQEGETRRERAKAFTVAVERQARLNMFDQLLKKLEVSFAKRMELLQKLRQVVTAISEQQLLECVVTGKVEEPQDLFDEIQKISKTVEEDNNAGDIRWFMESDNQEFWAACAEEMNTEGEETVVHPSDVINEASGKYSYHYRIAVLLDLFDYTNPSIPATLTLAAIQGCLPSAEALHHVGWTDPMHLVLSATSKQLIRRSHDDVELTVLGYHYHVRFWNPLRSFEAVKEERRQEAMERLAEAQEEPHDESPEKLEKLSRQGDGEEVVGSVECAYFLDEFQDNEWEDEAENSE